MEQDTVTRLVRLLEQLVSEASDIAAAQKRQADALDRLTARASLLVPNKEE